MYDKEEKTWKLQKHKTRMILRVAYASGFVQFCKGTVSTQWASFRETENANI